MARKPRAAAQAAAQSIRNAPPPLPDHSDEEIADAPQSDTPQDDGDEVANTEDGGDAAGDTAGDATGNATGDAQDTETAAPTPAKEPELEQDTPLYAPGRQSVIVPRKRRLGRPPKNKPPDWDAPIDGTQIQVTTPVRKRGRGRPPTSGGGRWAKNRGGPSHVTQVPIDKQGNMMDVINDEVALPDDPEGETKVDKMGNLLGGREYRVRIFTILNRGERQYMLSTEPARCIGFRDSYLFFQKHRLLYKIIIDDDEKRDLIERDIIPHSYKGRAIGVVTARSVFREFGAKIIIGGKKVVDDYSAQAARQRGDVEGEIAVPEDRLPPPGEPYNRNQYVAWHGASSVYHTGVPSVPMPSGKAADPKKRKVVVTGDNWMLEHAKDASRFNASLAAMRRRNMDGVYDIHSNTLQRPAITQPTHVQWEVVPPPPEPQTQDEKPVENGTSGLAKERTASEDVEMQDYEEEPATGETETKEPSTTATIFPPVSPTQARNLTIHDIQYRSPPFHLSNLPISNDADDEATLGLHSEAFTPEILALLPADCRAALVESVAKERAYRAQWKGEKTHAHRAIISQNRNWF